MEIKRLVKKVGVVSIFLLILSVTITPASAQCIFMEPYAIPSKSVVSVGESFTISLGDWDYGQVETYFNGYQSNLIKIDNLPITIYSPETWGTVPATALKAGEENVLVFGGLNFNDWGCDEYTGFYIKVIEAESIPEYPSIAFPIVGIIGMVLMLYRRRKL